MKKVFAVLLVLAMVLSCVTACGDTEAPATNNTSTEPLAQGDGTKTGRTDLNIPLASIGNTLNANDAGMMVDQYVINQIYEPLWYIEDDATLTPRLATDYTVSEDGTEITVTLREGVTFQNGEPFKASDVVFTYNQCLENFYKTMDISGLVKVEAVDDLHVKFTLDGPNSVFLTNMNNVWIVNEKAVTEAGDQFGAMPTLAGTGPYILDSYDQNTKIVLKAYPDYWRGEAKIKTITFTPMADSSTQLLAFQNGEFDFCIIPSADWNNVVASGQFTTSQAPSKHVSYFGLNVGKKDSPLYDLRVRQAFHYAIDKQSMCLVAADGFADPATNYVRPGFFVGAQAVGPDFSYNPEKAKELLAEAGYADGCDIGTMSVINGGGGRYIKMAQLLQENLKAVGIQMKLEIGETGAILTDISDNHTYDTYVSGMTYTSTYYDCAGNYTSLPDSEVIFADNENIDADYVNEMFDKILAEMDTTKRDELCAEVEEYVSEQCCYIPVMHIQNLYAWNKDLNAKAPLSNFLVYDWSWN